MGKGILLVYFFLSVIGRVSAIVVFFTPIIGLFNTLALPKFGELSFSDNVVYGILSNRTVIPLQAQWQPFQTSELLDIFPKYVMPKVYLGVGISTVALHFVGATILWKVLLKQRDWWGILYLAVAPPLFVVPGFFRIP